jgi:hypothetical protein
MSQIMWEKEREGKKTANVTAAATTTTNNNKQQECNYRKKT